MKIITVIADGEVIITQLIVEGKLITTFQGENIEVKYEQPSESEKGYK